MAISEAGIPTELVGWGRTTASVARVHRTRTPADIGELVVNAGPRGVAVRGLGRSSGDAAQNAGGEGLVLDGQLRSPALVWVDWERRLARLAGGASMMSASRALFAQGWFLPVAGRTAHVTIGGAVACDLHGPGHFHRGALSALTERIELVDGRGQLRVLEPRGQTAAEFWATFGGMGLTGVVVAIEVRVVAVSSAWMAINTRRCESHVELLNVLDQTARGTDYSYARIDTATPGSGLGRGVVVSARHAHVAELPETRQPTALEFTHANTQRGPRRLPERLLTSKTSRLLQTFSFRGSPADRHGELTPAALYFHAADQPGAWNGFRGDSGIVQYQCVVPDDAVDLIPLFLERLQRIGAISQQGILQRFGPGSAGPLSFPRSGWSLSIDFPMQPPTLASTLDDFDERVAMARGRVYLANDARIRPSVVPAMYPRLDEWREIRHRLDPAGRFASDLSRRLGL